MKLRHRAFRMARFALLTFVAAVVLLNAKAQAQDTTCDKTAVGLQLNAISSELKNLSSPSDQSSLDQALTDVQAVEDSLTACYGATSGSERDSALIAVYTARKARIFILQRLGRTPEAISLAASSASEIASRLSDGSGTINADVVASLIQLQSWMTTFGNGKNATPVSVTDPLERCKANATSSQQDSYNIRTAACLAHANFKRQAESLLLATLHSLPIVLDYEKIARAYDLLANVQNQLGEKQNATRHIESAYEEMKMVYNPQLESQIISDFKRISLPSYRKMLANEAAVSSEAYASATSGMSNDEKRVYNDEGTADHIETFESAGYSVITWWYNGEDGGYRVGYTFTNGTLTQIYRP